MLVPKYRIPATQSRNANLLPRIRCWGPTKEAGNVPNCGGSIGRGAPLSQAWKGPIRSGFQKGSSSWKEPEKILAPLSPPHKPGSKLHFQLICERSVFSKSSAAGSSSLSLGPHVCYLLISRPDGDGHSFLSEFEYSVIFYLNFRQSTHEMR